MYCKYCGAEVGEDVIFCPVCGKRLAEEVVEEKCVEECCCEEVKEVVEDNGPFKVFAKIGHIFGLISLIGCWTIILPACLSEIGIILSAIGMKSTTRRDAAKKGLITNIIAFVVSIILVVALFAFAIFIEESFV